MTTVSNDIVSKLRALLNMTRANGCTGPEADLAMERAQKLLLDHNLSMADIKDQDGTPAAPAGIGQIDGIEEHGWPWKSLLIHVIAKANLCYIVRTPSKKTWHLFGSYDNVRGTLEMYHWLVPQLESMALSAFREYRNGGGIEHGRTWNTGFFMEACHTLKTRLQKPLEEFSQGAGRAVVAYNSKAVEGAIKRVFPFLGHSSASYNNGSAGLGYGREAGSNVRLTPQRKLTGTLSLGAGR